MSNYHTRIGYKLGAVMNLGRICFIATSPIAVTSFLQPHIHRLSNDYEVFVVSNYTNRDIPQQQGVTYIHIPLARKIAPFNDLIVLWKLYKLCRKHSFDIVQTVTPKAGFLGMLASYLAQIPLRIHWFTGQVWVTRRGIMRKMLKNIDCLTAILATQLLADSPSQSNFLLIESVCNKNKINVIGDGSISGVDVDLFCPNLSFRNRIRADLGISKSAQIILFLGRLNVDKGLFELSAAMLYLNERYPEVHWLIVGPDEGGMVDFIRKKGAPLGERLHFKNFTHEPEAYMAASDIFCLPSYREGFGSAVLEAAAVGVPSVATKIYGLIDAVENGVTGILVPPKNIDALTSALDKMLSQPLLTAKMGAAARNRAILFFSRPRIVDGLHQFYSNLISSMATSK